jgi:tetratricopeptide (TPR) repeat protein
MKRQNINEVKQINRILLSCFAFFAALIFSTVNVKAQEAAATQDEVKQREIKTLDLLSRIDAFSEEDKNLKMDSAKAHYNMGNIYFEKGEYEIAAREYYQAVTLMPDDPDAHYNLAFVSGEYLLDNETALKHYQLYLYLKPDAEDKDFVTSKIVHSQMVLNSKIDSSIDKTK